MEFGIFAGFNTRDGTTQADTFDEWLGFAEQADAMGINCFWLAEFHFRPRTIVSAPLVVASAIASRTKRINLGIAVQLLPLANPVHLAEEVATLDHIAKGRLVFGVGRSSFVDAYQGYNVQYEESRPRFFECLEIIRKAWSDQPFTYEGEFYNYRDVNVVPKPYQKPHPPIRIACESRESFALMGKFGFPLLIRHQMPVPELRSLIEGYRAERTAAGFDGPISVTLQATVYVAESAAQARADTEAGLQRDKEIALEMARNIGDQEAYERLSRRYSFTYDDQLQRPGLGVYPNPYIFGSPEEVAERLQEYQEQLGITGISMTLNPGGIRQELVVASMRRLAERVIPRLN